MKCEIVRDLLPLYADGVCGGESARAVEEHLSDCEVCRAELEALRDADGTAGQLSDLGAEDSRKAVSFRRVKKRLLRRQILTVCAVLLLLAVTAVAAVQVLKHTVRVVEYRQNISVSMLDGDLVGRLYGSCETEVRMKRVTATVNGREVTYLFFAVSDTEWDRLTTRSEMFSEYLLCPAEKGAGEIDGVYYWTGDDTELETASGAELRNIIERSVPLWNKEFSEENREIS